MDQNKQVIKIELDPALLVKAEDSAGNIVFEPGVEDVIVKVLSLQEKVNDAIKIIKSEIESQGLAISPAFSSVTSDKLKVNYSAAGAEFAVDDTKRKKYPEPLFTTRISHTPNSKAIKEFRKRNKRWPQGVSVKDRQKSIRISLREQ